MGTGYETIVGTYRRPSPRLPVSWPLRMPRVTPYVLLYLVYTEFYRPKSPNCVSCLQHLELISGLAPVQNAALGPQLTNIDNLVKPVWTGFVYRRCFCLICFLVQLPQNTISKKVDGYAESKLAYHHSAAPTTSGVLRTIIDFFNPVKLKCTSFWQYVIGYPVQARMFTQLYSVLL